MSELIRKITGIGGPDEVNYIPVIHYCVCDSAANEVNKIAKWIGDSEGLEATPQDFELYKGITIAVLFTNGFGIEEDAPDTGFTLQVHNSPQKQMMQEGDSLLTKMNPGTIALFSYDGNYFRLVSGITGAQFNDLREEINKRINDLESITVKKGGENNDESKTGDTNQPIYVFNDQVVPIVDTIGSSTNPVWLNEGHFMPSDETVGGPNQPVFLNGGTITAISATIGSNIIPIFLDGGSITSFTDTIGGYDLEDDTPVFSPVFMDNGAITVASSSSYSSTWNIGDDVSPLKMSEGKLVSVTSPLATKEELESNAVHSLDFDGQSYVLSATSANGATLSAITLPLEAMVVGATYTDGNVILELKNGTTTSFPVVDIVNGLVKDSEGNGEGSNEQPVYVDETGTVKKTTYDLSTFVSSGAEKYHNGGTYDMAATNAASGLITTITGNNVEDITLTMPIYWGNGAPTVPASIGTLYIELDDNGLS